MSLIVSFYFSNGVLRSPPLLRPPVEVELGEGVGAGEAAARYLMHRKQGYFYTFFLFVPNCMLLFVTCVMELFLAAVLHLVVLLLLIVLIPTFDFFWASTSKHKI